MDLVTEGLRFPEGPVAMPDGSVVLVEIERGCRTRGAERQVLGEAAIAILDLVQLRRQGAVERGFAAEYGGECLGGGQTRVH